MKIFFSLSATETFACMLKDKSGNAFTLIKNPNIRSG